MAAGLILAIDQGTTNTKALLVDRTGEPCFRASRSIAMSQPQAGYVEQDPWELWESVVAVASDCLQHAVSTGAEIEGIALSTQRESGVTWLHAQDGSTNPVGPVISWQCRRSAVICDGLRPQAQSIRDRSGLPLDPLITAGKWCCVLQQQPHLLKSEGLRIGNVDAWLVWNLTAGQIHATDHTNASRTGLLNLLTLTWDDTLLALFRIPRSALPEIRTSSGNFGVCTAIPGLVGVPIVAVIGDSHAAMVGHGTYTAGSVKATYGTGSSLMTLTRALSATTETLARTVAWSSSAGVQYALEGNIAMAGAALQWVGEFLGSPHPAEDTAALAETVPDSAGLVFVPAQVGLGAPYWDTEARGAIVHLERFHRAAHLARAAVESIAFQVADVFVTMEEVAGIELGALQADGGATRNTTLMQFQADVLGKPVLRSSHEELSALGAALLGGLQLGWWPDLDEIASLVHAADRFEPRMSNKTRAALRTSWKSAIQRVRLHPEEAPQ